MGGERLLPQHGPRTHERPQDVSVVVVGGESGGTYKMIAGSLRDSIVKVDDWR
ncbi:MAG TPA: hypothetical protein VF080_00535 [Solirubrobacteraceae bacterium]